MSQDLAATRNQAGISEYYFATEPSPSVTQVISRTGRYIRVQLVGKDFLSLAEVQIFGNHDLDNQPPTISNPGAQINDEGETLTLTISASDPEGDPLTYSATGLPPGLTISPTTGIISGTITVGSVGIYTVTASVSDGEYTVSAVFTWTAEIGGPVTGNDTEFFVDNVDLTFCTLQPPPNQLPGTGQLNGMIFLGGELQPGITVWAYPYNDGLQTPGAVLKTYTIHNGTYSFHNMQPGNYLIYASISISNTAYFDSALRRVNIGSEVRDVALHLTAN